jgi:uncharacterized protein DUF6988
VSRTEDISNRGAEIRSRLRELLPCDEYPSDTKTTMLFAYVDIALEHHEAIFLLIKSKLFGSAFALVRPLLETMFRALWINEVANQSQIEKASRDELKFPCISQMLEEIDKSYSSNILFRSFKGSSWKAMCSYAHSGALQIARRFTNGEVKPSYSDAEILEVLRVTSTAVMLLTGTFFVSMGCHREADETKKMIREYAAAVLAT